MSTTRRRLDVRLTRKALLENAQTREGKGALVFVPSDDDARAGEEIELVIRFDGFPHEFTMWGQVVAVRTQGRGTRYPRGVTIEIPTVHDGRIRRALAFAAGERVEWHPRAFPRFPVHFDVRVATDTGEFGAQTIDLSQGGARLSSDTVLPSMGEEVVITVYARGSLLPLKVRGRVRWLDFFQASRGFGVEFTDGGLAWRSRLEKLLHRAGAATPDQRV